MLHNCFNRLVIILLLFGIQVSYAHQSKIDSLFFILKTAKEETTRVNTLNILGSELMYKNPDTSILLGKHALSILTDMANKDQSKKSQEFSTIIKKLFANSYSNLGVYYWLKGDYPKSLMYHLKAFQISKNINNKKGLSVSLGNLGLIYSDQGDYPKALKYYFEALKIDKELGNKLKIAASLSNIGIIYKIQGDYSTALNYYYEALEIDKEVGNKTGISKRLCNIGIIFRRQGNFTKALQFYNDALVIDKELKNKNGIANRLNNIGTIYLERGDSAIATGNHKLSADMYSNALQNYFEALKINKELDNKNFIIINLCCIGNLYTKQKKHKEAKNYLNESLELSQNIGDLSNTMTVNQNLSDLYVQTHNYQKAYEHFKQYSAIKDTLFNEEKSKELGRLEQKHEFEMVELENERIKNEKLRIKIEELKRRNLLQYSGILLALVFLFMGIFLLERRFKKIKEHKNYLQYIQIVEATLFISFLIFFEFILVFLDPYLENFTGGEPIYKLLVNTILAGIIFPLHSFLEKMFKPSVIKAKVVSHSSKNSGSKTLLMLIGFIFISFVNISFSDKEDSLQAELIHVKDDTTKINLLNKLFIKYEFENREIAKNCVEQALELSIKANYKKGLAQCYIYLGYLEDDVGNYSQAILLYEKSLHISKLLGDDKSISATLGNIGLTYWNQGNFEKAFNYYFKALKIDEKLGNKSGISKHLGNIGILYDEQGDFSNALKYYFKALIIDEEQQNKNGIVKHLGNIGIIYREQKEYSNALNYFLKALKIGEELSNKNYIAIHLGNIGNIYNDQNNHQKALIYYLKALKMDEILDNKNRIARHLGNIGMMYYDQANKLSKDSVDYKNHLFNNALDYYFKALNISKTIGSEDLVAAWLGSIGLLYTSIKKYNEAEKYLLQALDIDKKTKSLYNEMYDEQNIYNLYEQTGRYHLALNHHKKAVIIRDSLFNEKKSKEIGRLEQKHEYGIANMKRIQEEAKQARIGSELKERKKNLQYSAILIGIFFLFGMVFFLGKISLPEWLIEFSTFVPFIILFEFILVLFDPFIENYTGGEPVYKLLINAVCATIIFPIHGFFEKKLKTRVYDIQRKKEEKFAEEFKKEVEKY